ncbi:VOC family protein [Maribacter sp. MAR_2009_72]|uniref:VOC family protein n=1 Tax=Maribacter sp. MAR_2009_72 TaxID=1250050 RepID=UPI001199DD22|nr:VOC family protein [Maribacter sp. MAR_2009_72]TVZ16519.1 catechol 2,3-dioxygenase [Maribacter sp. MAR_2009_72]
MQRTNGGGNPKNKLATFGPVHINNIDLERSTYFWTEIVGMQLRGTNKNIAEFGTEKRTLVVVHEKAKFPFQKGYSGLYHFAVHAPNEAEFASMVHRLNIKKYPYSPTDHTASKSIYLEDPDGITIEFTLETPERLKRVISEGGIWMEGTDGVIRSASERLNLDEVMSALQVNDLHRFIASDTYIGHIHLYANNVQKSNRFYKKLGYTEANNLPQYMFADLGDGADYQHRIALNSWHGSNRPLAPSENAGLNHFQLYYTAKEKLEQALHSINWYEKTINGYWVVDPTGNKICIDIN